MKVVLVGDPRQLPEIDAGGVYSTLTQRLEPIELTGNRRQTVGWEIEALDQLRHGDPSAALDAYTQQGRVVTADSAANGSCPTGGTPTTGSGRRRR